MNTQIRFVINPKFIGENVIQRNVDISFMDKLLQRDDYFYINKIGNISEDERERFAKLRKYIENNKELYMPHLHYDESIQKFGLLEGRHTFFVFRDSNLKSMPFSMDKNTERQLLRIMK